MRELLHGTQKSREKGKRISDEAMKNLIFDKLAGATTQAALAGGSARGRVLLDLPYTGSKAMLKMRNTYITA